MKTLLVMRHGEAPQAKRDQARMLNDYGKQQGIDLSKGIREIDLNRVSTSDYQRAIDSADLFCSFEKPTVPRETSELLRPMSEPKQAFNYILDNLENVSEQGVLLVVCHLPIIAELASLALDGTVNNKYSFSCASVMCLTTDLPAHGCFDFMWQKVPK